MHSLNLKKLFIDPIRFKVFFYLLCSAIYVPVSIPLMTLGPHICLYSQLTTHAGRGPFFYSLQPLQYLCGLLVFVCLFLPKLFYGPKCAVNRLYNKNCQFLYFHLTGITVQCNINTMSKGCPMPLLAEETIIWDDSSSWRKSLNSPKILLILMPI